MGRRERAATTALDLGVRLTTRLIMPTSVDMSHVYYELHFYCYVCILSLGV